jgi:uncharacterized protein (DUF1330 family)
MAAYVIVSYDIVDNEGFSAYVPAVTPLLQKHGAEVLVASFDVDCREGEKRGAYVVLKFDSEEAARRWYEDPDYEPAKKIRLDTCTNNNLVIAGEFEPPES